VKSSNTLPWIVLGGSALAIALLQQRSATSPAGLHSQRVLRLAEAIAFAEGFGKPGALPTVLHNPGDLTSLGGSLKSYLSDDEGWEALYQYIESMLAGNSYYSPDMSINSVSDIYSGSASREWAVNVAAYLGVSPSTPIGEV